MKTISTHPELIQTVVKQTEPPTERSRRFDPVQLFVNSNRAARFWFAMFLASSALPLVTRLVGTPKAANNVIVLDAAGSVHEAKLLSYREARALHAHQATLATQALLSRTPADFDNPELLEFLYSAEAFAKAKALFAADSDDRIAKQIHQKVEIATIDLLRIQDDVLVVEVTGQLIRNGSFKDQSFFETLSFRLRLRMAHNRNLVMCGRFPTVVTDFKYEPLP